MLIKSSKRTFIVASRVLTRAYDDVGSWITWDLDLPVFYAVKDGTLSLSGMPNESHGLYHLLTEACVHQGSLLSSDGRKRLNADTLDPAEN